MGWVWFQEATSPISPDSTQTKIFVIKKGESVRQIAERLNEENFIRSPVAFFLIVKQKNLARKIQAGDFRLSAAMSAGEIAEQLTHGTVDVWITIPEGWRNGQIAMELARTMNISESQFLTIALEGYMFPDTYLIPKEASAVAVVKIFTDTFDKKVRKGLSDEISRSELPLEKIVILASIVEREAKHGKDRPLIAGVLMNRFRLGMPLQADATLQYIKGYDETSGDWWPSVVAVDKALDSPYNTYENPGLPPGAISNPGLAALKAAANPAKTEYLYYLSQPDGTTYYAKTLEEHNENVRKYLQSLLDR